MPKTAGDTIAGHKNLRNKNPDTDCKKGEVSKRRRRRRKFQDAHQEDDIRIIGESLDTKSLDFAEEAFQLKGNAVD